MSHSSETQHFSLRPHIALIYTVISYYALSYTQSAIKLILIAIPFKYNGHS